LIGLIVHKEHKRQHIVRLRRKAGSCRTRWINAISIWRPRGPARRKMRSLGVAIEDGGASGFVTEVYAPKLDDQRGRLPSSRAGRSLARLTRTCSS
jgi:hypothetical protein